MSFAKEFKEFAVKGNVMDLAVGVIIGAAFGKIVDSVVNDLIMPIVGIFFKADFSNLYIPLASNVPAHVPLEEARKAGPVLAYGNFITIVINFIFLALIVFLLVKGMNRLRRTHEEEVVVEPPASPEPTATEKLLMEIRDELRK